MHALNMHTKVPALAKGAVYSLSSSTVTSAQTHPLAIYCILNRSRLLTILLNLFRIQHASYQR